MVTAPARQRANTISKTPMKCFFLTETSNLSPNPGHIFNFSKMLLTAGSLISEDHIDLFPAFDQRLKEVLVALPHRKIEYLSLIDPFKASLITGF